MYYNGKFINDNFKILVELNVDDGDMMVFYVCDICGSIGILIG